MDLVHVSRLFGMEDRMRLYHVSNVEITTPDLKRGRKNADFGQGFYLTPDEEFARKWAEDYAVLNIYELDTEGLDIHEFSRDKAWFEYIFNNRRVKDMLSTDVVIGPIANDTIFDTLGIISSGFLKPEDALSLLLVGPCYTQVAVKTEKALNKLKFIESQKIERQDKSQKQAEEEAYQEMFASAMEKLDG